MTKPFKMFHVQVKGKSRDRGRAHGEALRPQIRELSERLSEAVQARGLSAPASLFEAVVENTGFIAAARTWTPDLLEEAEGIAEGAGMDRFTILGMQLLEELDWYTLQMISNACTVVGVGPQDGHHSLLCQNADNPEFLEGYQTLLEMEDGATGLRAFVLTYPGLIGAYGVNDCGIGVCVNEMVAAMNSSPMGLGTLFISRGILALASFDEAAAFVGGVPHASGNTFTVGTYERVVAFEAAPGQVIRYKPSGLAGATLHTNHPLVNEDRRPLTEFPGAEASRRRMADLERRVVGASRPLTVEAVRGMLSSHDSSESPICRHDATRMSFVVEFTRPPVLHVASGPPCMTEFRSFRFAEH